VIEPFVVERFFAALGPDGDPRRAHRSQRTASTNYASSWSRGRLSWWRGATRRASSSWVAPSTWTGSRLAQRRVSEMEEKLGVALADQGGV